MTAGRSTSILAFHKLARDEAGAPALILERHGSLGVDVVLALARRHGFSLVLGERAHERLAAARRRRRRSDARPNLIGLAA